MSEYVKNRNKMIVFAEVYANKKCGITHLGSKFKNREEWAAAWNKTYFAKMDDLVRQN